MANRAETTDGAAVPDVHRLLRFAPVVIGAALGVLVAGGYTASALDDQAPGPVEQFDAIEDELESSGPSPSLPTPTTIPPPTEVASLLVDLAGRGLTPIDAEAPFGPLADAPAAAELDADESTPGSADAIAGLLRLSGFTRGHASLWSGAGTTVVGTMVLEFETADGATRYGGALDEIATSDPTVTPVEAGIDDASAYAATVDDGGDIVELFQSHAVRGARIYRVLVIASEGETVDAELGRSILAEQAAVG